ncbi:MAG TPA: tRNA pseudouridine(13) synthase TruD [Myxococcota bacterium]|nr:tRNA pseudouridine(13) synthase TruD [Myxococcota bacterium]HQK52135.1 tRNA pseudouridine(13) synthase TruD [Myxococcota bacterium]
MNVDPLFDATLLDRLPRACPEAPRFPGRLKEQPEDFEVEEIPAYLPEGRGDHLFLWVQKRDVAGGDLIHRLAAALGVPPGDLGHAGTKDRRAVTRQWISAPARCEDRLGRLEGLPGIQVIRAERHPHKIRTGHLRGNRFRIRVRGIDASAVPVMQHTADAVTRAGFPNFFGTQRFGRDRDTLRIGLARLLDPRQEDFQGRRLGALERRMSLSAVQSALFNRFLAHRIEAGLAARVLPGDVLQKVPSGGLFHCREPEVDQERLEAGEVRLTGPVWGHKMMEAEDEAGDLERQVLLETGIEARDFRAFARLGEGTRRPLWIRPEAIRVEADPEGVVLTFDLPSGCYATVLLREFLEPDPGE